MIDHIEIQLLDESGNWRTMVITLNISAMIRARMEEVQRQFPASGVRAEDAGGGLVDLV